MNKTIKEEVFETSNTKLVTRYTKMILALFISAILYNMLLQPSRIVLGGTPGIALILNFNFHIEPAITIIIISMLMLLLSYIFLGKERTTGTVVATIVYPLFVYITKDIVGYINIDFNDLLVISIFIGVISGFANGMLYKTGFSNGGLPVISQILYKYFNIPIGKTNLIINAVIVIIGGLFFGSTMIMYAIIANFINSLIVDKMVIGMSKNKAVYIMTEKKDKIKKFLIDDMKHTATVFEVKGGFLNTRRELILTVIPTKEYFEVTESIKIIDPKVFYVVNNAYEVKGGK